MRLVSLAAACAIGVVLFTPGTGRGARPQPSNPPNVVLFLLDDTNPTDGRLWDDPALTPNLYNSFVAHGTHFTNAIDDTSLCCPARATLLTGLHSFNHGVTHNDVQLFNPDESIAVELTKAGYDTMLIGKYMNHPEHLTGDVWTRNAAPWSVFDVFTSPYDADEGYFYDYTVTTKDGQVLQPDEHSTKFITDDAVRRIGSADPAKPIFAELSLSDTHLPNLPMPGFENDPRWAACDQMAPWNPPNYNEADVSDKPPYMQKLPLLPDQDGWPMATYCQEMLGVDWMVGQVTDELLQTGRLDNTLLIFTADNGMAWGQHRLTLKQVPYSTYLPLYMSWPARWGHDPRQIDEYTSNIDIAPTICDVAGCTLGPFPTGQNRPDGVSLVPLIEGLVPNLGRDALIETEWEKRPWAGLQTTGENHLGLWQYVEYQSGFRELYNVDPREDPWELHNLAYDPAYGEIESELHDRLLELLAEGRAQGTSSLEIVEDALPNAAQDFQFGGDLGSFALDDDSDATLQRTTTFSGLQAGSYTITQTAVPAWMLSSITCPAGSTIDLASGTVTVNVQSATDLTCTFRNARRRPDALIATATTGVYRGNNVYSPTPLKRQTQKSLGVAAGSRSDYLVSIQNDGRAADSFKVKATSSGSGHIAVSFESNGVDVTADVLAGTFSTGTLDVGASRSVIIHVDVGVTAPPLAGNKVIVSVSTTIDAAAVDVVRAITAR